MSSSLSNSLRCDSAAQPHQRLESDTCGLASAIAGCRVLTVQPDPSFLKERAILRQSRGVILQP